MPAERRPVQDDWLATFNDPQLDALVREAIVNNPDLRVAGARVEQAAQVPGQRAGATAPVGRHLRHRRREDRRRRRPQLGTPGHVAVASWELDLWGRLRYARNAADEDYRLRAGRFRIRAAVAGRVHAKAWFTATQLTRTRHSPPTWCEPRTSSPLLAQDRERVGAGTDVGNGRRTRERARAAKTRMQQVELARDQALRALELLVGRYPAAEIALARSCSRCRPRCRWDCRCRCSSGGRM